jgi:hypothetical protein
LPKQIKELLVASGYATLCAITDLKEPDINVILGSGKSLLPGHVVTLKRAAEIIRKLDFEALLEKSISFQQPKKPSVLAQKNNSAVETSSVPSVVVLQNMVVDWLAKKTNKKYKNKDIIVEINPLCSTLHFSKILRILEFYFVTFLIWIFYSCFRFCSGN